MAARRWWNPWVAMGALLLAGLDPPLARARVYLTQARAIELAFPAPQTTDRRTLYLTEAQAAEAGRLAGTAVAARIVPYYVGALEGKVTGYAYFDTHLVRTLHETVLVVLDPGARIRRIDIVSFDEPEDYLPTDRWLQQFSRRGLDDELALQRGLRSLTGATLSARSVTEAARRVLALHTLFVARPPAGAPIGP